VSIQNSYEWRRQLLWGLILIGFGTVFFLDRADLFEVDQLWHYWPLLLVIMGVNKMIGYPTARHFTGGLWLAFVGVWLFANFEHLYGMTFHNSWPLLIIAVGVKMIIEPFMKTPIETNSESGK
jgi:hypothetical protein